MQFEFELPALGARDCNYPIDQSAQCHRGFFAYHIVLVERRLKVIDFTLVEIDSVGRPLDWYYIIAW